MVPLEGPERSGASRREFDGARAGVPRRELGLLVRPLAVAERLEVES
jgi:hypothetical protein